MPLSLIAGAVAATVGLSAASFDALPDAIRIGDVNAAGLVAKPEVLGLRVDVATLEPHALIVESADADVLLIVENAAGERVAEDDDSGVETNAHLVFTPPAVGTHVARDASSRCSPLARRTWAFAARARASRLSRRRSTRLARGRPSRRSGRWTTSGRVS